MEEKKVSNQHDVWMQKILAASQPELKENEPEQIVPKQKSPEVSVASPFSKATLVLIGGVFLLSLFVRLYYLFVVSDPQNAGVGWYNDSYHHWQIAYLTKEIGLGKGFLRLWDLVGVEYFWGLLHPLFLATIFTLTNSADIVVSRLLNVLIGSVNLVLLFLLGRKYFSWQVGLGAALIGVVNPVGIFTDTSGMQEPLAICMMLAGLYYWPKKPYLTAIFLALASMSRAEYWLFSIGIILTITLFDTNTQKKLILGGIFSSITLLYMKYLLDKTGNALYPIYWNFFGNAFGKWQADIPLTPEQETIRVVFILLLLLCTAIAVLLLIKRPRGYLFSLLGVGNFMFLSFFVGLTAYLKSYLPRFWVDRIFLLPYLWVGFVIAIVLFFLLPKFWGSVGKVMGWLFLVVVLVLLQCAWLPIQYYTADSARSLQQREQTAARIMSYYHDGSLLFPGNDPVLTYELYKHGLQGRNMRGEMFDPYYYGNNKTTAIINWLTKENIRLILFEKEERYKHLVTVEKEKFIKRDTIDQFELYEVKK